MPVQIALDHLRSQTFEAMTLRRSSERIEERPHLCSRSLECHGRELMLGLKMLKVGIEQPVIGFFDPCHWRWFHHFSFDQITKQQLQDASRHIPGRVICTSRSRVEEINLQKGIDEQIRDLLASGDSAFDQKRVELATLAQNLSAPFSRISLRLQISGKAIEVRTERAASEVDERALFFVPVF